MGKKRKGVFYKPGETYIEVATGEKFKVTHINPDRNLLTVVKMTNWPVEIAEGGVTFKVAQVNNVTLDLVEYKKKLQSGKIEKI